MRIYALPPSPISTSIDVAPASIEFSISSFTTDAGRSTTSPAAILLIVVFEITLFKLNYKLSINISDSLPFKIFLVDKRKSSIENIKNGDYIQFKNSNTRYYGGKNITKKVLAVAGSVLQINQYQEPIENIQATIQFNDVTLKVKDHTTKGTKVYTNIISEIPSQRYFVYGTHKDSFDSRYAEFGLIKEEEIIGVAVPLF